MFKLRKVSTSATRVKFPVKQFSTLRGGRGGGGGEVGLEKLCVPVEKFGLYT